MLQNSYSRFSSLGLDFLDRQKLPTGKAFGGSNLNTAACKQLPLSPVNNSVVLVDTASTLEVRSSLLPVVEVGKIICLALWLWVSIGINFCLNSISGIDCSYSQDL